MDSESSIRAILASKLKEYRVRAGLTVYEAGEALGKSGKTVSAWENGRGQPDAEMFVKLYKLYNVESMSEFYGIEDKDISPDEQELLNTYRNLSDDGKKLILANAKAIASSPDFKRPVIEHH